MPLDDDGAADTVAGIARAVPGVTGLHTGMFGEVATYLPGRSVPGVRITDDRIDVHISVAAGTAVRGTAAAVRAAVGAEFPGTDVDVTVEDVTSPQVPDIDSETDQLEEDR